MAIISLAMIGSAFVTAGEHRMLLLAFGGLSAVVTLAATLLAAASGAASPDGGFESAIAAVREALDRIQSHTMLSDNARRVLFREREVQLLRDALEEQIRRGAYNAGITLCDDMAELFGLREEAETYRQRIHEAGQQHYEAQIRAALTQLDSFLADCNWAMAHEEAARIRRLFGGSHLVQDLDERILRARNVHKRDLEHQFLDAAQRSDVEQAMPLLKELDRYLSRDEAARLADVAGEVVDEHRKNLGVQFKLAVSDKRWSEAAQIGNTIMSEFPNTKMAEEVHAMIEVLRTRATAVAAEGT
jgi:hypothetical protein